MASRPKSARKPNYSVHPEVAAASEWIEDLPRRTGRSLEEWLALIEQSGPKRHDERADWLRRMHGLNPSAAARLAERAEGKGFEKSDPQAYLEAAPGAVDAMYSGAKEALRPLRDRLIRLAQRLGPDVRICPWEGAVPLFRQHLFARIKAATRSRIDLALAVGDQKAGGRLLAREQAEPEERITHRILIRDPGDIDLELERWLRKAYELDGPDAFDAPAAPAT